MSLLECCLTCGCILTWIDADPNGDMNCVCAKCRAEEKHDYDKEPNVKFNQRGERE